MSEHLFLAVESVIPASHPAAILALPLGLLFFGGSIFLLLWSNYGAKKGAAMYGTAFFGVGLIFGVFFWFGGPGIPASLGITHLPGQPTSHYNPQWYGFEPGSPRAEFYPASNDPDSFQDVVSFTGREDLSEERLNRDPKYASTVGSVGQSVDVMANQYLPVDENGVAQIGAETRAELEEAVSELIEENPELSPEEGVGRAPTFYTAEAVGEPRVTEDQGVMVVTQRFRTVANFVDRESGVPVLQTTTDEAGEEVETAWPVGDESDWFAFLDPGAMWFPSMLWTVISLLGFAASLFWLDRLELRDKRLALELADEPEDLAVPIAQCDRADRFEGRRLTAGARRVPRVRATHLRAPRLTPGWHSWLHLGTLAPGRDRPRVPTLPRLDRTVRVPPGRPRLPPRSGCFRLHGEQQRGSGL